MVCYAYFSLLWNVLKIYTEESFSQHLVERALSVY